jgi:hypothetical protein
MRRPGRLPVLVLMMVKGLIWSKVMMDHLAMPALHRCTVMVFTGAYRVLQVGRKSCLPT